MKVQSCCLHTSVPHWWFWNDCMMWGLSSKVPFRLWALWFNQDTTEETFTCCHFLLFCAVVKCDDRACYSVWSHCCIGQNRVKYYLNVVATIQWCVNNIPAHAEWATLKMSLIILTALANQDVVFLFYCDNMTPSKA